MTSLHFPLSLPPILAAAPRAEALPADERYPWESVAFAQFVADSYRVCGGSPTEFTRWIDAAVRRAGVAEGLAVWLEREKRRLAAERDPQAQAHQEIELARRLFALVKKIIPRFSFDRGFEFAFASRVGERQCLLQSVLVASFLQRAGVVAGAVMVWRSESGEVSNNGHAVTLLRRTDGRDRIVDVSSHHEPFVRHRGLFLAAAPGEYRFVVPEYVGKTADIRGYRMATGEGTLLPPPRLRLLDTAFLRSQFDYYRGEQTPGGLLSAPPTSAGLHRAAERLAASVRLCPANPLAVYMFGRALARTGDRAGAQRRFEEAWRLYRRFGWVPESALEVASIDRRRAQLR